MVSVTDIRAKATSTLSAKGGSIRHQQDSPRHREVDMAASSPPTPRVSSLASDSPASIAAPRAPIDIEPGYHVEVVGADAEVRRPSRSHSKPEPERSVPSMQDPYLASEEAGDRANVILATPGSQKFVPSPTMRSKLPSRFVHVLRLCHLRYCLRTCSCLSSLLPPRQYTLPTNHRHPCSRLDTSHLLGVSSCYAQTTWT